MYIRTQENKLVNLDSISVIFQQGNLIKAALNSDGAITLAQFDTFPESVRCFNKISEEIAMNKSLINLYTDTLI